MSVHLHHEIDRLKKKILALGAMVESALQKAVRALKDRDIRLADKVIEADFEIDQAEVETEEECLKILALYQPVANDLRFVVAVLKINNDLERIADQAVNIAERAKYLSVREKIEIPADLTSMVDKALAMLKKSLESLVTMNPGMAHEVIACDDEIDTMHRKMYEQVQERIRSHPDHLERLINILSVSRQLERVADQVTNIAEDVIYMVEGEIIRHNY